MWDVILKILVAILLANLVLIIVGIFTMCYDDYKINIRETARREGYDEAVKDILEDKKYWNRKEERYVHLEENQESHMQ